MLSVLNCCRTKSNFARNARAFQQKLTHVDDCGLPTMVDVTEKAVTKRVAHARGFVLFPPETYEILKQSNMEGKKGPIIATAIIAGVMAAKNTSNAIPFCHPVPLDDCNIKITPIDDKTCLQIDCTAKASYRTGIEMEALVGVSNAALCIYDMCKALTHEIVISNVKLISKTGGKSTYPKRQ